MEIKLNINVKWLAVFVIGIVLGIGITSAYPTIGDPDSYFNYIHGDCSNCSKIPAGQIVGNFTQRVNFSSTIYATGLTTTSGSDVALCRDAATQEVTLNVGFTDCSSSLKAGKENIQTIEQTEISPEKFNALKPVSFNFRDEPNRKRIGLIAEEVAVIYPDVIAYGNSGEVRGIRYNEMIPLLIEKIQSQDAIINQQSIVLNRQAEAINALQNEIKLSGNGTALTPLPTSTPANGGVWSWLFG